MAGDGLRELAVTPPGPALATLLEVLDPAALAPGDAVAVLRAWSRQRAHDHARMAATMARVAAASRTATLGLTAAQRGVLPAGDWAGVAIAAALTWSESKACRELRCAHRGRVSEGRRAMVVTRGDGVGTLVTGLRPPT